MGDIVKLRTTIIVFAAVILLQGSSPWEGAAATAPEGVLPQTGYYAATNSFPKNTVVDITNIETNKSIRVIVAGGLNSPGLLAVVSREAAEIIGMKAGSISRIRMVQPSDPIAYLRFTESMATGFPDYDSGNVITEQNLLEEVYGDDTYRPPAAAQQTGQTPGVSGPSYLLEPEWSGTDSYRIIDLPGYTVPAEQVVEKPVQQTETPRNTVDETPQYADQSLKGEIVKNVSPKIQETPPREIIKDVPDYIAEPLRDNFEKDNAEFIAEEIRDEIVKDVPVYIAETARDEIVKDLQDRVEPVEHIAETPPPEEPVEEILQPEEQVVETRQEQQQEQEQQQQQQHTEYVLVPTDEKPPEGIYGIDPSEIIPGITAVPTPSQPPLPPPVDTTSFSVPRIYQLDRGSYYVQLASLDTLESVENAVSKIDHSYQPKIYKDGDNLYRVLLGPLNQGESAAVLQRFKTIGYKDAFVRQGR